jgi:CRISPR/Cas system-associated endonuclease Cas3-HD
VFAVRKCQEKYRLFFNFLLDGTIVDVFTKLSPCYSSSAKIVIASKSTKTVPAVLALQKKKIDTKPKLVQEWKQNPLFLQKEMIENLVNEGQAKKFKKIWNQEIKNLVK